jgi:hypothetical protein
VPRAGSRPVRRREVCDQGTAVSADSLVSLITGGLGALGVMGIWLALMVGGRIHTDSEFQREAQALEREKAAHDETRRALAAAAERADTSVRAASLIADALTGAHHREHAGSGE